MIADQYIGNGRTAGLTGIPCLKDRVHMLICPGKRNRTSREVDEYDGSAGLMKAPQKLLLKLRELDLDAVSTDKAFIRSEEHTSELQSRGHLVCRLLLEKQKKT